VKLSVFTTASNASERGDNLRDALNCYTDLANEVICIDGGYGAKDGQGGNGKRIAHKWPIEFDWSFIGNQFQRGYEACTGDIVIHADLDFIFHEKDFEKIREACKQMLDSDAPALSFYKHQFVLPDRYNLKSRLVIAVNKKKYGDRIRFDSGGDLAQPSLNGKYISPDDVPEARIPFYNYEKILKSKEQIKDDTGRMARAWQRHFGEYKLGGPDDESAFEEWLKMQKGRLNKPQKFIELSDHPLYMQGTIKNLRPENFGYSAFGEEVNSYVSGR
jgi:hypothetical protein